MTWLSLLWHRLIYEALTDVALADLAFLLHEVPHLCTPS
jgi:hypothetical protein